jgi:hypothetical protein
MEELKYIFKSLLNYKFPQPKPDYSRVVLAIILLNSLIVYSAAKFFSANIATYKFFFIICILIIVQSFLVIILTPRCDKLSKKK